MVSYIFYIFKISVVCLPLFFWEILSLTLLGVRVPTHAIKSKTAVLECNFDLDGEDLYSVKWYKDGYEIFRFMPKNNPPVRIFQLAGIYVDQQKSTKDRLVLSPVILKSSGEYLCEVSTESPSFETVLDAANMTVVAIPEVEPRITGAFSRYKVNERLAVNCTSGRSKPGANLRWLINGENVPKHYIRGPWKEVIGTEGLEITTLGLEFRVKAKHFKGGDMRLECLATVNSVYSKARAETVGRVPIIIKHTHHTETKIPLLENNRFMQNSSSIPTIEMVNNRQEIPKLQLMPSDVPSEYKEDYVDMANEEASHEDDYDYISNPNNNDTPTTKDLKILSRPKQVTVLEGDKVEFECEVNELNPDLVVRQWYHDTQLIYLNDLFTMPQDRKKYYNKTESGTLTIYNISASDAGDYHCAIHDKEVLKITHHLTVKIPAKIEQILPNDNYAAVEGETLSIVCTASGIPAPTVTWAKGGERFAEVKGQDSRSTYTFEKIKVHDAGTYSCIADNKVGDPVIKQISIRVQHKPHMLIEKSIIGTDKNFTTILTCSVHANPVAVTEWFKDKQRIIPDGKKYRVIIHDHDHILYIYNTQESDFGKYICNSTNHLGTVRKDIQVFAKPEFIKLEVIPRGNQPLFKWQFESVSPIEHYSLRYRHVGHDKEYIEIEDDFVMNQPVGTVYSGQYGGQTFSNGHYQLQVDARNKYGATNWSPAVDFKVDSQAPAPENISTNDKGSASSLCRISVLLLLRTYGRVFSTMCHLLSNSSIN